MYISATSGPREEATEIMRDCVGKRHESLKHVELILVRGVYDFCE